MASSPSPDPGGGRPGGPPPNRWHLSLAVRTLAAGGVLAYPTEAVWGLGCNPLDPAAVNRLLALKGRPVAKGLILIAADLEALEPFVLLDAPLRARVEATWPGPVTWLLPARPRVPPWLRGRHATLAVRIPAHPPARALCRAWGGPLVSTSANPAGRPPARSRITLMRYFDGRLDGVLPGPLGGRRRPTEIRDAATGVVLRRG